MQNSTDEILAAAFRAAFAASLPRISVPSTPDRRRALILDAAKDATFRVVVDLRRMGSSLEVFPADAAQRFIEEILAGERYVPTLTKTAANALYSGLLAVVSLESCASDSTPKQEAPDHEADDDDDADADAERNYGDGHDRDHGLGHETAYEHEREDATRTDGATPERTGGRVPLRLLSFDRERFDQED
ncbi:MAG: hypothetical protein IPK13_04760 [Deltaproteobacteria bacterium]|nr:hypothetical protein [Deltaproteobacteria bacterium]